MAPSYALLVGAKRVVSETQPMLVNHSQLGSSLSNAVLSLLFPLQPGRERLIRRRDSRPHNKCMPLSFLPHYDLLYTTSPKCGSGGILVMCV